MKGKLAKFRLLKRTCLGIEFSFLGVSPCSCSGYGAGAAGAQGGQAQGEGFSSFNHVDVRSREQMTNCLHASCSFIKRKWSQI